MTKSSKTGPRTTRAVGGLALPRILELRDVEVRNLKHWQDKVMVFKAVLKANRMIDETSDPKAAASYISKMWSLENNDPQALNTAIKEFAASPIYASMVSEPRGGWAAWSEPGGAGSAPKLLDTGFSPVHENIPSTGGGSGGGGKGSKSGQGGKGAKGGSGGKKKSRPAHRSRTTSDP